VTPRKVRTGWRKVVAIRTGEHEEHIVADVAWAANQYAAWTGDRSFLTGDGRALMVETARYWAARVRNDGNGAGHLFGVMGPDEYHEVVDDNAYTNLMARWNLRRGAELLVETGGDIAEARQWREIADTLVDGWDPDRQMYEQFAGYWALEPLLMRDVAEPPAVADMLIGAARVAKSQLIKQADVLMAHHLLPGDVMPGSLTPCLSFYEPRCAHGSSLSPAIHASLLARAGRPDDALALFRLAARLDLDDVTGTTAGGVHLAAMGGVWQALAYGFLGLAAKGGALRIDPCLPKAWDALALRFRFGAASVRVRADRAGISVLCDEPLDVVIGDGQTTRCEPPGRTFMIEGGT
jgi:trehalose/maltose hydrolase-like predicted phosphorylase